MFTALEDSDASLTDAASVSLPDAANCQTEKICLSKSTLTEVEEISRIIFEGSNFLGFRG